MTSSIPESPENRIGFLLYRAGLAVARGYERALAPTGISPTEAGVLSSLAYSGPAHVRGLARLLGIGRQTTVNVTKSLAQRGYIERVSHEGDARLVIYSITAEGRSLLATSEKVIGSFDSSLAEIVGDFDAPAMITALQRVVSSEELAHDD